MATATEKTETSAGTTQDLAVGVKGANKSMEQIEKSLQELPDKVAKTASTMILTQLMNRLTFTATESKGSQKQPVQGINTIQIKHLFLYNIYVTLTLKHLKLIKTKIENITQKINSY